MMAIPFSRPCIGTIGTIRIAILGVISPWASPIPVIIRAIVRIRAVVPVMVVVMVMMIPIGKGRWSSQQYSSTKEQRGAGFLQCRGHTLLLSLDSHMSLLSKAHAIPEVGRFQGSPVDQAQPRKSHYLQSCLQVVREFT